MLEHIAHDGGLLWARCGQGVALSRKLTRVTHPAEHLAPLIGLGSLQHSKASHDIAQDDPQSRKLSSIHRDDDPLPSIPAAI